MPKNTCFNAKRICKTRIFIRVYFSQVFIFCDFVAIRFDCEIELPVPDANARIDILHRILEPYNHRVSEETIKQLGRTASHGFVGADLGLAVSLANTRAANAAQVAKKTGNELLVKMPNITNEDLIWAFTQVKPSAMREIFVEVPNVRIVFCFVL